MLAIVDLCSQSERRHWDEVLEKVHNVTSVTIASENLTQHLQIEIHSPAALNNFNKSSKELYRQRRYTWKVSFFKFCYNQLTYGHLKILNNVNCNILLKRALSLTLHVPLHTNSFDKYLYWDLHWTTKYDMMFKSVRPPFWSRLKYFNNSSCLVSMKCDS